MYTTFAEKDQPTLIRPFERSTASRSTSGAPRTILAEAAAKKYSPHPFRLARVMEALSREKILQAVNSPGTRICSRARCRRPRNMGGDAALGVGCRSTTPISSGIGSAQDLRGPARPEVEGQARHRAKKPGLVRLGVDRDGREREGCGFSASSWRERHFRAHRTYAAQQHGDRRRGAVALHGNTTTCPSRAKKKGAPIDWFALEARRGPLHAIGVARRAPHPNARSSSTNTCSAQGQEYLVKMDYVPRHEGAFSAQERENSATDPIRSLDETDKWTKLSRTSC